MRIFIIILTLLGLLHEDKPEPWPKPPNKYTKMMQERYKQIQNERLHN